MTTKKQKRADRRIQHAKNKKGRRFHTFMLKVAGRRLKDPRDSDQLMANFCCLPDTLEMPREEFLSKGQELVGGMAVLFDRGELEKLLPNWRCSGKKSPTILMVDYIKEYFQEDGRNRSNASYFGSNTATDSNW